MTKIFVEQNARNKLFAIAEIMEDYEFRTIEMSDNHWEEEGQPVIDDFYIETEQTVRGAHVLTSTANFQPLEERRQSGALILGSAHGHGKINVFYSDIDRDQINIDLKAFNGFQKVEYADLDFKILKDREIQGKLVLRAYNCTNIDLLFDPKDSELVNRLKEELKGRMLKSLRKEVWGITINKRKELYGIKRIRDSRFIWLPGEKLGHEKKGEDFEQVDDKTIEYSIESKVVPITRAPIQPIDKRALVEELEAKVIFTGPKPSSFKRVFATPQEYKDSYEKAARLLLDYAKENHPYSATVAQTAIDLADKISTSFTQLMLLNHSVKKADEQKPDLTALTAGLRNDKDSETVQTIITEINQQKTGGWSLLKKKDYITEIFEKYFDKLRAEQKIKMKKQSETPKEPEKKYEPKQPSHKKPAILPKPESQEPIQSTGPIDYLSSPPKTRTPQKDLTTIAEETSKIIKCNPNEKFDKIYGIYLNQIEKKPRSPLFDYVRLKSINHNLENFCEEFKRDHNPILERLDKILDLNKDVSNMLARLETKARKQIQEVYERVTQDLDKYQKKEPTALLKSIRFLRDAYFSLGDEKANEMNQLHSRLIAELREKRLTEMNHATTQPQQARSSLGQTRTEYNSQ